MSKDTRTYFVKNIIAFCVVYLVALFSMFRANVNYIDDLGRAADGYRGWDGFSRWISQYFSPVVHGNQFLADMSPMPQMLAILIIAISSTIILYVFVKKHEFNIIHVFSVLPIGLSPYFLECFSYKFDSPYMALSVLGCVIPFLFTNNLMLFFVTSAFGLQVMCMTYQAGSGIYLLVLIFYCLKCWHDGEQAKKLLIFACVGIFVFIFSLVVYKVFFVRVVHTYVSSELGDKGIFSTVISNAKTYLRLLKSDANKIWKYNFYILVVLSAINFIMTSKKNKVVTSIVYSVALVSGLFLSYGAYLALGKPLFATRGMYGFGVYVSLIALLGVIAWEKNFFMKVACCYLSWLFFAYSFLYGNALAEQKRFAEFRIQLLINDLNALPTMDLKKEQTIVLVGGSKNSPVVDKWCKYYPVLGRQAHSQFGGTGWGWHKALFWNYYKLPNFTLKWPDLPQNELAEWKKMPLLMDHRYHIIRTDGKNVLVELK